MTDRPENRYSEIELAEIFRIIWKWKYLIVAGVLAFAAVAAVVSLNRPKIYRVSTALKLGAMSTDRRGNKVYIDTLANIKALVQAGTFNTDLREHFKTLRKKSGPIPQKFQVSFSRRSNVLRISCETSIIENGINALEYLPILIIKTYEEAINKYKNEYDKQIRERLNYIIDLENKRSDAQSDINNTRVRLKELESRIRILEKESKFLSENNISPTQNQKGDLNKALLYSNVINQNLILLDSFKKQYFDYQLIIEKAQNELNRTEGKLQIATIEMEELKKERDSLKYIEIIQAPAGSKRPVKPRIMFNVIIASTVGVVSMLFLTFFLEYLFKYKSKYTNGKKQ